MSLVWRVVAGGLAAALAAGVLSAPVAAQPASRPEAPASAYRVQVNDTLEFLFFKNTELNQARTVGPDGTVNLQLIGSVTVAGRTLAQITEDVTARYARELTLPQVTVAVKEFGGLRVYVGGEVNTPGIQPYRGGLTTLQAVVAAGGFKSTAGLKDVVLIRKGSDGRPTGATVDLDRVVKHAEFDRDVPLVPADIIFVPRSGLAKVNLFVEQVFKNNIPIPIVISFYPLSNP